MRAVSIVVALGASCFAAASAQTQSSQCTTWSSETNVVGLLEHHVVAIENSAACGGNANDGRCCRHFIEPRCTSNCAGPTYSIIDTCSGQTVSSILIKKLPPAPASCGSPANWCFASAVPTVHSDNSTAIAATAYCRSGNNPASAFLVVSLDAISGSVQWAEQLRDGTSVVSGLRDVVLLPFPAQGLLAAYDPIGGTAAALHASDGKTLWVTDVKSRFNCQGTMLPARSAALPQPPLRGASGAAAAAVSAAGQGNMLLGCAATSGPDTLWIAVAAVNASSGNLVWRTDLSTHFPSDAGFAGAALAGYTQFGNVVVEVYNQQSRGDGVVVLNALNGDVEGMRTLPAGFQLHGAVPQWGSLGALAVSMNSFSNEVCANQVFGLDEGRDLLTAWTSIMTNDSLPAKSQEASCGGHLFGRLDAWQPWGRAYVQWDSASAIPGNFSVNRVRIVGEQGNQAAQLDLGSMTPPSAQLGSNTMVGFNRDAVVLTIGTNFTSWPWSSFHA